MEQGLATESRQGGDEQVQAGDEQMARADLWAEDLEATTDPAERRLRMAKIVDHARAAARAYTAAPYPWGLAQARLTQAAALAVLAEMDGGDEQGQRIEGVIAACEEALSQVDAVENAKLSLVGGIWTGCAQVLAQVYVLMEEDPEAQQVLEDLIAALGAATGEALWWDSVYHQQGEDLLLMAQIVQPIADLEEDPRGRLEAAQSFYELASSAGAYLQQTGDLEQTAQAYNLYCAARVGTGRADGLACVLCGRKNDPGRQFCTNCGTPLAEEVVPTQVGSPTMDSGHLVVLDGPSAGQRYALADGLRIGRTPGNDVVLGTSLVSRHHAVVQRTADGYAIVDLESSNGTYVNDVCVVKTAPLRDGDTVTIGRMNLAIQLSPDVPQTSTCPSCGKPVVGGHRFCGQCGAQVD